MKHFTIAYTDENNNYFEICEYAERSDEAIKNAMDDIPILKRNHDYIFRCTNESDLEWLLKMENFKQKEWNRDLLFKEGSFVLQEIRDHLTHILSWVKISLKNILEFKKL